MGLIKEFLIFLVGGKTNVFNSNLDVFIKNTLVSITLLDEGM